MISSDRFVAAWREWVFGWAWFTMWTTIAAVVISWIFGPVAPVVVWVVWAGFVWWRIRKPGSFQARVATPIAWATWQIRVRTTWDEWALACGLAEERTEWGRSGSETTFIAPRVVSCSVGDGMVHVVTEPIPGQKPADWENRLPELVSTTKALTGRITEADGHRVGVLLVFEDVTKHPGYAVMPVAEYSSPEWVDVGRRQDGSAWDLSVLGRHILIAGATGAGKGSVMWGIIGGLAPLVDEGTVQLWGVDLKGGVELSHGRNLFCHVATTQEDALAALQQFDRELHDRLDLMALWGSRKHDPTAEYPMHVLVLDEILDLLTFAEMDIRRAANKLLSRVLTKGRAAGFVVVACTQIVSKDALEQRDLFSTKIALRLKTAMESQMVLGDGMDRLGAAHRISILEPGAAYVTEDETGLPVKVRADYWSDELIQEVNTAFQEKRQVEVAPVQVADPFGKLSAKAVTDRLAALEDVTTPHLPDELVPEQSTGRKRRKRTPRKRTAAVDPAAPPAADVEVSV